MHSSGLLILTSHISSLCKGDRVAKILMSVKKLVKSTLYVHLNNVHEVPGKENPYTFPENSGSKSSLKDILFSSMGRRKQAGMTFHTDVLPFVTKFYSEASLHCGHLDVNVLLHNIGVGDSSKLHVLKNPIHCILIDLPNVEEEEESRSILKEFVTSNYTVHPQVAGAKESSASLLPVYSLRNQLDVSRDDKLSENNLLVVKKDAVVLGGTFDHIHAGHKVLLSEAILLAHKKIVIGLSDGPLLERKTLKELIQPIPLRKKLLEDFIYSVARPGLDLYIETIYDPYGPSITVPDLDIILVSKETEKGGHMVNARRKERGLSQLEVHIIGQGALLGDAETDSIRVPFDESKASSSNTRFRLLGTLLKPGKELELGFLPKYQPKLHIIGLTGGIAAGKSSVAKRLQQLGAIIIDCDKLGHKSYLPGSKAIEGIVKQFGEDIICTTDGTIDRKKLGEKVFSNKSQLTALNGIVWPEIERLCKEEIAAHMQAMEAGSSSGKIPVFVLDAAVLLEAEWDKFVHEVWVINVPPQEAIKRIVDRNNIPEANAKKRIESQATNEWRTGRANVVLSTIWEPNVTQKLVEKAWGLLHQRIGNDKKSSVSAMHEKSHKL